MSNYEAQKVMDPALPFIFHNTYRPNKPHSQPDNWHKNIEILAFIKGTAEVTLNERRVIVSPGDTVIVNSNCLHSVSSSEELIYYCLIVDHAFCLQNYFDTSKIFFKEVIHDERITERMCRIAEEFENQEAPYRTQTIRAHVLDVCAHLCRFYSTDEEVPNTESHLLSCIKQALGHIHTHYKENISLDEIAEMVGLSKFYFAREFHRVTGYTLVSYINLVRCESAKKLLKENRLSAGVISRSVVFPTNLISPKYLPRTRDGVPANTENPKLKRTEHSLSPLILVVFLFNKLGKRASKACDRLYFRGNNNFGCLTVSRSFKSF